MASNPFQTAETFKSPAVRQLSIFLEDKVGSLLRLFKAFEGSAVHVVGMSIVNASDCAIVRLICDDSDTAEDLLDHRNIAYSVGELMVVEIPPGQGLMSICSGLLTAEVNINYAYPMLIQPTGRAALAIHADNLESGAAVLRARQFTLMAEEDLGKGPLR